MNNYLRSDNSSTTPLLHPGTGWAATATLPPGFTLIELIVTIAVSSIIATIVLAGYVHISKGHKMQLLGASRVNEIIKAKKKIDKEINRIDKIILHSKKSITYKASTNDSVHTLTYKSYKLFKDQKAILSDISQFGFIYNSGESNKTILFWEAILGQSDWIGGVKRMKNQNPGEME